MGALVTCDCAKFGADMTWHERVLDLTAGGLDQLTATQAVVCPEAFPAAAAAAPTDWGGYVRAALMARLPWLRETGGAEALPVALVCLLGVCLIVAGAVR